MKVGLADNKILISMDNVYKEDIKLTKLWY